MNDIVFFLTRGWDNTWKQRTVWLFTVFPTLIHLFSTLEESMSPIESLISVMMVLVLWLTSFIGIPYLAYRFSSGSPATIREVVSAVRKFSIRFIGCSCLVVLILLPFFAIAAGFARATSTQPVQNSGPFFVLPLLFALIGAMIDFPMFEFFAKDASIRESLRESWKLFTAHFSVLAALGLAMAVVSMLLPVISGILTVLVQSGFDPKVLSTVNILKPSPALQISLLFVFINGIIQTLFSLFHSSVFVLAYLKYSAPAKPIVNKLDEGNVML